jgi:hypothetical protein
MTYMVTLLPSGVTSAPDSKKIDVVMLPPDSSKLDGVSDDMETEPGSPIAEGESFHSLDDDPFQNFDYFFPAGLNLETLAQYPEELESADECEDPTFREAAAMSDEKLPDPRDLAPPTEDPCPRPVGCPVDPCRIIVDLTNLTMKTQLWLSLPSIPENEPMYVPTPRMPWWKYCFGIAA